MGSLVIKILFLVVPLQVQLLKREYFNRWYRLNVYYLALVLAKLPIQITLAIVYITMVYLFTDQPISVSRMLMFYTISILVSLTSESWGLLVASRLRVVVRLHLYYLLFNLKNKKQKNLFAIFADRIKNRICYSNTVYYISLLNQDLNTNNTDLFL